MRTRYSREDEQETEARSKEADMSGLNTLALPPVSMSSLGLGRTLPKGSCRTKNAPPSPWSTK